MFCLPSNILAYCMKINIKSHGPYLAVRGNLLDYLGQIKILCEGSSSCHWVRGRPTLCMYRYQKTHNEKEIYIYISYPQTPSPTPKPPRLGIDFYCSLGNGDLGKIRIVRIVHTVAVSNPTQ